MKKLTTFHLFLRVSLSILLLSWLAALPVAAQVSTGQISGMIKDAAVAPSKATARTGILPKSTLPPS